ncbi:MAG: glycosyltransferase family 39 protein [Acidimicrobiales bacterium]
MLAVAAWAHLLVRRRRVTIVAAALMLVCPLWLVLSATFLSYAFSASLGLGAGALLLLGAEQDRPWLTAAAGLLGGLAFYARPFDALLVIGPCTAYLVWERSRHRRGPGVRAVTAAVAGATPGVALLLLTNWRITGDPLRLGYSLVGPLDSLGFGDRLDTPAGEPYHYGIGDGFESLWVGTRLTMRWTSGAWLGFGVSILGLWRLRRYRGGAVLAAIAVLFPLGYFFVWGAWNAHVRLQSADWVGPYYYLPTVLVLTVGLAVGVDSGLDLARRRRLAPSAVLLGSAVVLVGAGLLGTAPAQALLDRNRASWDRLDRQIGTATAGEDPVLVLLQGKGSTEGTRTLLYTNHGYNDLGLDGRVVYAIDDPARLTALLERFPGRDVVRETEWYVLDGRPGDATFVDGLGFAREWELVRHSPVRAATIVVTLTLDPVAELEDPFVYFTWGSTGGVAHVAPGTNRWTLELEAGAAAPHGVDWQPASLTGRGGTLCVGVADGPPQTAAVRDEACVPIADHEAGVITTLSPATTFTGFAFGDDPTVMLPARIDDRLEVDVAAADVAPPR